MYSIYLIIYLFVWLFYVAKQLYLEIRMCSKLNY